MIVGLTGGIGSGKSTVCELFNNLNVPTTSADLIARQLVDHDPVTMHTIVEKFGEEYLGHNKSLDRKKIRALIFKSPEAKIWLEELLHPGIKLEIKQFALECNYPYCVIEIPLLFEAKMEDCVDRILSIDCSEELQIARASTRDKCEPTEISAIIASQTTNSHRLELSDDVLTNTGNLDDLSKEISNLHNMYLKLATAKNS